MSRHYKIKAWGPTDCFVVVFVCLFLLAVIPLLCHAARSDSFRMVCLKNLSVLGKAIRIYANDFDGKYPRAGGPTGLWTKCIKDWKASNRFDAYGLNPDGSGGRGSIPSCFYLLVKYTEVEPITFVCPSDTGTTVFNPADYNVSDEDVITLWDFGPSPANHCSYAYHMPFYGYDLTTSSDPDMAVAADRNPWIPSGLNDRRDIDTWEQFNPADDPESAKLGNSLIHEEEGQNVLFVDGHVSFEESPSCGVNKDNIYTYWDNRTNDIQKGDKPQLYVYEPSHGGKTDSILVNDSASYKTTTTMQAEPVDSNDLERTQVVATLDGPLPEHKNVIWCSTFQIAWDKLKDDIISEPVMVRGAEELASRLNQVEFSPSNLEGESFYATAGFIGGDIIEQIQQEIKKRFNSEPVSSLNSYIGFQPDSIVTFSYLDVNVGFKYPFHTYKGEFVFVDSTGIETNVTSFCTKKSDANVYEQIDILFYEQNKESEEPEFAVDLCKYTQPYQIVLARVSPSNTLAQTLASVKEKISDFKKDPNYERLRKVRDASSIPSDSLVVPDVLFKLTHRFKELINKFLANPKWSDYSIIEALQMIDFTLSRTGVTVKSWSYMIAPPLIPHPPRKLHFDRPFLIYVQKRGEGNSPFFVMWVDNAELMNPSTP